MKLVKKTYEQELHPSARRDIGCGVLELEIMDGGGGDYLVVHATEWALDGDEEIDALCAILKGMFQYSVKPQDPRINPDNPQLSEHNSASTPEMIMASEPKIHSYITDVLSDDYLLVFEDVVCDSCKGALHSFNNECMTTWVETSNGNYCLECFAADDQLRTEHNGTP